MKELAKEYIYITHRHRQQWGDGQKEGGGRMWVGAMWEWAKEENGTTVNHKNKVKNKPERQN